MPTVTKTWVFLADAEGLADVGDDANFTAAFEGTDGSPAAGSINFLSGTATNPSERMRRATTGQTWETWGVPAGATVTDLQVTAYNFIHWGAAASAYRHRIRVLDSAAVTVHAAGDLVDASPALAPTGSWRAGAAGLSRAVDAGRQASTTDVRLEVQASATISANIADISFDTIELTITYTTTGPTSLEAIPADVYRTVEYGGAARIGPF